ncbi:casein kinase ii subunit alpha-3 [Anaeramoeba flamelloides]|uniref:non-specific serine/threonine protein kinase n=1 Tax=Anaeramoeba flamelloides TaxID=1746091 RepID=A0ABQ8ZBT0_9EUKA|nr:casein kinase ii subunit alpha-3 [Anaeramoeba flamelloides]
MTDKIIKTDEIQLKKETKKEIGLKEEQKSERGKEIGKEIEKEMGKEIEKEIEKEIGKEKEKDDYPEPKHFSDVNLQLPSTHSDYENYVQTYGDIQQYRISHKVGRGRYSDVFVGKNVKTKRIVAIKILKKVKEYKYKRELKVLSELVGYPNILQVEACINNPVTKSPTLITNYVNVTDFRVLYPTFSLNDAKYYMYQLLKALYWTHRNGIMHRDVKPQNVLIDYQKRTLTLVDWGLAEFYFPGKRYHTNVATRYFKAPELLVGHSQYHYSVDMWAFGCLLAGIIFIREPLWQGMSNEDQLTKIINTLGTSKFEKYLLKYKIKLPSILKQYVPDTKKKSWKKYINQANIHLATDNAIDLISKLLVYDPQDRLDVIEAMNHPWFDNIRDEKEIDENLKK